MRKLLQRFTAEKVEPIPEVDGRPFIEFDDSLSSQLSTLCTLGFTKLRNGWLDNKQQWLCQIEMEHNGAKLEVTTDYWNSPDGAVMDMIARLRILGILR